VALRRATQSRKLKPQTKKEKIMTQLSRIGQTIGFVLASAFILGGCAVGQKYQYSDVSIPLTRVSSDGPVGVGVHDVRPYVVSGGKPEAFVGLLRGGYGMPFDVTTESGKPMTTDVRDAIVKAMQKKGLTVTPVAISPRDSASKAKSALVATNAKKLVLVTINEWKTDSIMNTELIYDVTLAVLDGKGEQLAVNRVNGSDNLGSLGMTPHAGVSAAFARKFDAIFDDDKIIAALR
jgi:hypothetical protein